MRKCSTRAVVRGVVIATSLWDGPFYPSELQTMLIYILIDFKLLGTTPNTFFTMIWRINEMIRKTSKSLSEERETNRNLRVVELVKRG